jgi:hypothetical protein
MEDAWNPFRNGPPKQKEKVRAKLVAEPAVLKSAALLLASPHNPSSPKRTWRVWCLECRHGTFEASS